MTIPTHIVVAPGQAGPRSDYAGMALAIACAIHCASGALFAALLAVLGISLRVNPWLEWGFVAGAVVLGGWSLGRGIRQHQSPRPTGLFVVGLLLLCVGRIADAHSEVLGLTGIVLGASCIVTAHGLNLRLARRSDARQRLSPNGAPACANACDTCAQGDTGCGFP